MRGHTSDNLLAATLAGLALRAQDEQDRRAGHPDAEFFAGRLDAARELALLLNVRRQYDAVLTRDAEVKSRQSDPASEA